MLLDGSDNSTVGPILGYLGAIQTIASRRIGGFDPPEPVKVKTRFLFNPELNSRWFAVPGLAVAVMAILSVLLTALTVAREWEDGSMELLLSTPVEPLEIIVGKLAPYAVLGIIAVTFTYIMSRTVFGVPFEGSLITFGAGCMLFLAACLAQGLLISVVTRNQQIAMQVRDHHRADSGHAAFRLCLPDRKHAGLFPVFHHDPAGALVHRHYARVLPQGLDLPKMGTAFAALGILCAIMVRGGDPQFQEGP